MVFCLFCGSPEDILKASPLKHIHWEWPMSSSAVKMQAGDKCQWLAATALKATRYKCVMKLTHGKVVGINPANVDMRVNHLNYVQK